MVGVALINRGAGQDFEFCQNRPIIRELELTVTNGNVNVR